MNHTQPKARTLKGTDIATRFVSALRAQDLEDAAMHEALSAFHAPSECYADVDRRQEDRRTAIYRHYARLAGMSPRQFVRAVKARVSARCAHFTLGL